MASNLLTSDNPVFASYVFFSGLCILKLFLGAGLVVFRRITRSTFSNEEDLALAAPKVGKVSTADPVVERARRNHQNDLENIIPFVLLGFLYISTNPSFTTAVWHFRVFFFSRMMYFICYQMALPAPSRPFCYTVGFVTCLSMLMQTILAVW